MTKICIYGGKDMNYKIIDLFDGGINVLCGRRSNTLNKKEHSDLIKVIKYQEQRIKELDALRMDTK